jgi:hypothetical protein
MLVSVKIKTDNFSVDSFDYVVGICKYPNCATCTEIIVMEL